MSIVSNRILAILFLMIATVSGFLRFNSSAYAGSMLLTVVFLIAAAGFLAILLRILSLHVLQIGESMSNENKTRSD